MFDRKIYKETFSQVHASEETLTEVLKMTKHKKKPLGRVTRALLIAAILSAMLATTAFAYVGFTQYENSMEMLKSFFGSDDYSVEEGGVRTETYYDQVYEFVDPTVEHVPLDEEAAQEVAPYISDVGKSITFEDYTLTVVAHHYDSVTDCGIIYYTLENPNGVSGYEYFSDGEVWWPNGEPVKITNISGKNFIVEDETTDTKLSVACYYASIADRSEVIRVEFRAWIKYKPGEMTEDQIYEFEQSKQTLTLSLDDGGGMKGITLANGSIALSPIGMIVNAEKLDFLYFEVMERNSPDAIESFVIRYNDGTDYTVLINTENNLTQNYVYSIQNSTSTEASYCFNRLVDIDKVEAVIINDIGFTDLAEMTDE